jgi:hypothetical protein
MPNNKSCKGISYNISGKNYCIGERKTKTIPKTRTRTRNIKTRNIKTRTRKTRTRTRNIKTRTIKTRTSKKYLKKNRKTRTSKKYLKKNRKTRTRTRTSKKTRKNLARGPGDDDYYDITQCCMCSKTLNVNDKTNALIPLECLQKRGNEAHRICKECWFKPVTGFAIEGNSHKCPGCKKGLPFTPVKFKTPEMVDLTMDSD